MHIVIRRTIAFVMIVTAIPLWLWLGISTSVYFDTFQLYNPALPLWIALLMVIMQVLWACHIGEKRPSDIQGGLYEEGPDS